MWIPFLLPFRETRHTNFFLGAAMGCLGGVEKVYMCFFGPLGLLLESAAREVLGKSLRIFLWGSSGNSGKSRKFPEALGKSDSQRDTKILSQIGKKDMPLAAYHPNRRSVLQSIQIYIHEGCSWLMTSISMQIHIHQIIARISRIEIYDISIPVFNAHSSTPTPAYLTSLGKTFDHGPNKTQTKTRITPDPVFTREGRNSDYGLSFWGGQNS